MRELDPVLSSSPRAHANRATREGPYDPVQGLPRLRELGVRYFLTTSEETTSSLRGEASSVEVATFGPMTLFDLGAAPLVSVLSCAPQTVSRGEFRASAESHFREWTAGRASLATGLPEAEASDSAVCTPSPSRSRVYDVDVGRERIEFRTEAVGSPHLVRASFFPNWRVTGARGPYLASPWFMIVVPEEETVVLDFGLTWVEPLGWVLTLLGIALLVGLEWRRARRSDESASFV